MFLICSGCDFLYVAFDSLYYIFLLLIFLVFPKEGDAHPLGALPIGTLVNCVEKFTGQGGYYAHAAGTCCTVMRRIGDRVIIQLPSKQEVSLPMENMAVVGWYLLCAI